ncbi:MAG: D-glycero-beta-D-manno-heptose 1,7-bisphosphate 7-phosphatase [Desulfobulbaceae bacterium]|nr:D-glycero-beta-D-manno-heptose 1,7-bisphosphate 7-phosphatase [Desulfobulbaceae bacterium]
MSTSQAAVFLDRDGTINEQMGYINHISRFHLLPNVALAIRALNEREVPVVVISNQSGVGRGYFPESLLTDVHEKMNRLLAEEGAKIDGLYYCPHHPEAREDVYRIECDCRKPRSGMLEKAARDLNLDLAGSYVVGDRWSDLKTAERCNASGVLVLTGYGRGDLKYIGPRESLQPHYIAEDLLDGVQWILRDMER